MQRESSLTRAQGLKVSRSSMGSMDPDARVLWSPLDTFSNIIHVPHTLVLRGTVFTKHASVFRRLVQSSSTGPGLEGSQGASGLAPLPSPTPSLLLGCGLYHSYVHPKCSNPARCASISGEKWPAAALRDIDSRRTTVSATAPSCA